MASYSFQEYLEAKQSVDDRAINLRIWEMLHSSLVALQDDGRIDVLELGCGAGAMLRRMLSGGLLTHCRYTAIDSDWQNIAQAQQAYPRWLAQPDNRVAVEFIQADAFEFLQRPSVGPYHLVIAHAFLDLVDVPAILQAIRARTLPGGLWYFTINFDGLTILEPEIDPNFDRQVLDCYHRTMDTREVSGGSSGGSRTGRRLFRWLRESGARLLAAGSSDWVVFPLSQAYPAAEASFLHHLIDTIDGALRGHPELNQAQLSGWIAERHNQIDAGALVLIAHQLDFLAEFKGFPHRD